mgnify:CR=1 FL=1
MLSPGGGCGRGWSAAVILTRRATGTLRVSPIDLIAYAFSLFTVWGCGAEAVLYGSLLLLLGLPFYVRTVRERQHAELVSRQPPRRGET